MNCTDITYFLGEYAAEEIAALVRACSGAKNFVDVGANIGLVSLTVARACPTIKVLAFEPVPQIAQELRANLALNPTIANRCAVIEMAVDEHDGIMRFLPSSDARNAGVGRLSDQAQEPNGYEVRTSRLDTFFSESAGGPDIVKVDVEGTELKVLRGMRGLFDLGVPHTIFLETHAFYHRGHQDEFNSDIVAELIAAGYRLRYLYDREWLPLDQPTQLGSRGHLLAERV